MPHCLFILARGTDDAMIKVIFGIVFFIIWAVSAAVSAVAKKQQEAKRRALAGRAAPPPPMPARTAAPQAVAKAFGGTMARASKGLPPRQTAKAQPRPLKLPKAKAPVRRPVAAAPPPVAAPARSAMQAPPTPTTHLAGGSAGSTTVIGGGRAAVNPLITLMNPRTLRTVIITNELLQPPVALRDQGPPLG